jgi:tRNA threonylcarbamoyladenosine biosynthesis protein TsaB
MLILGIDTATTAASAALVEDGKLVREAVHDPKQKRNGGGAVRGNHAATLLPLIDGLLKNSGRGLSDVNGIAVALGPGSFTGLRIGLSTVKGLVYGSDTPVVGVPTLHAVAARVDDFDGFICPFLDARKKEVYAALFHKSGERLERVVEDAVAPAEAAIEAVRARIGSESCLFIGDAVSAYEDLVKAKLAASGRLTLGEGYRSTAAAAALIGEERLRRGESDPVGPLAPIYLRPSEAELKRTQASL